MTVESESFRVAVKIHCSEVKQEFYESSTIEVHGILIDHALMRQPKWKTGLDCVLLVVDNAFSSSLLGQSFNSRGFSLCGTSLFQAALSKSYTSCHCFSSQMTQSKESRHFSSI